MALIIYEVVIIHKTNEIFEKVSCLGHSNELLVWNYGQKLNLK